MPKGLGASACEDVGWFKMMRTSELDVNRCGGGLIIYHEVMLKVELVSDKRFYSADGWATA